MKRALITGIRGREGAYLADVEAMWRALQQYVSDDFVVGNGESHSVEELLEAFLQYPTSDMTTSS